MNWLLIAVLVVILGLAVNGYHKGFIRILISFLSIIVTLLLVGFITPYVGEFLKDHTPLYDKAKESISGTVEELVDNTGENGEGRYIPNIFKSVLESGQPGEAPSEEAEGLRDSIGGWFADVIVHIASYVVAFLIITLLLRFTLFTFDFIANLPVLKGINKFAGLLLGLAEGLLVVWIGFLLITMIAGSDTGKNCFRMIGDSQFLKFLYENNFLLKAIMGKL